MCVDCCGDVQEHRSSNSNLQMILPREQRSQLPLLHRPRHGVSLPSPFESITITLTAVPLGRPRYKGHGAKGTLSCEDTGDNLDAQTLLKNIPSQHHSDTHSHSTSVRSTKHQNILLPLYSCCTHMVLRHRRQRGHSWHSSVPGYPHRW